MIASLALGLALVDPPMIVAVRPVPPAPAAAPAITAPTTSTTPIVSLFSEDDYPVEAMRLGQQGTVSVDVAISSTGRPSVCTVTTSSGSAALDTSTCNIIMRRARYRPALDVEGRPMIGHDVIKIRWALPPPEYEPFEDRTIEASIVVRKNIVESCSITILSLNSDDGVTGRCPDDDAGALRGALDYRPNGVGDSFHLVFRVEQRTGDVVPPLDSPRGAVVLRAASRTVIDPRGKVEKCEQLPAAAIGKLDEAVCAPNDEQPNYPPLSSTGVPAERVLIVVQTAVFDPVR